MAIASLREEDRLIIENIYIKRISRRETCRRLFISENTLHRRKKKAVAAMADMISIIF